MGRNLEALEESDAFEETDESDAFEQFGEFEEFGQFEEFEFDDEVAAVEAARDAAVWVPEGFDEMVPGPFLAALLTTIDVSQLSGHDQVIVLRARQRMASHYQANVYADIASISDVLEAEFAGDLELATMAASAEIRAALCLTRRAADTELDLAITLRRRLPAVWAAFSAGDLDVRRARTIAHGTEHLTQTAAQHVADLILPDAVDLTTGQIAARLRKLCITINPNDAAERYETAVEDRHVELRSDPDGTAQLVGLNLAPDRATEAADRINRIAQQLKTSHENRTIDQLRADVFLDLLCNSPHKSETGDPSKIDSTGTKGGKGTKGKGRTRGRVMITVDLATLTGLADHPGDLAGYGPVIADLARQTADQQASGMWEWVVTDPVTGQPVAAGATRRRPTAQQQRIIRTHSPHCVMKGCRVPATHSDIDHTIDWANGGPTQPSNLDPNCRHDHRIKHQCGWTYQKQPDGTHQWTSRLGHTYTNKPEPP